MYRRVPPPTMLTTAAATPRRTPCRDTWSNAPSRRAWPFPSTTAGADTVREVADGNATELVTWVHSYVTTDRRITFCYR